MTEPTDEELDRAERIRRLREGEALPRRERRRPDPPDAIEELMDGPVNSGGTADQEGPLQDDDFEMPADAPDDLTVASLYLREDFEERLLGLEAHLDRLIGNRFDGDVDGPRHVRPLALYLGVRQIEKLEAAEIVALFESIDEVESP